jgi:hypothetical protein
MLVDDESYGQVTVQYTTLEGQDESEESRWSTRSRVSCSISPVTRGGQISYWQNNNIRNVEDLLIEQHELAEIVESSRICDEGCSAVSEIAFSRSTEHQARFKSLVRTT